MTSRSSDFIVEYSTKDIMDKLHELSKKLAQIHQETMNTNGRVTLLEKRSIGTWASQHPFKLLLITLVFFAIVISDSRDILIELLWKLF